MILLTALRRTLSHPQFQVALVSSMGRRAGNMTVHGHVVFANRNQGMVSP